MVEVNFDPQHTPSQVYRLIFIPEIEDVKIEGFTMISAIHFPNPYPQHNETAILYAYDNGWHVENIEFIQISNRQYKRKTHTP